MTTEQILGTLDNPIDADGPEHAAILTSIHEALDENEYESEALDVAITICDEFMNWAEHVKQELRSLKRAAQTYQSI